MPRIALQVGRSRGACSVASLFSPQLKRLLTYVRPYSFRFTVGVILVAFVALAEGGVALMIRLAVDFVLNPGATSSRLPLGTIPWSGRVIYLNDYFPARIHHVWTVFAISLVILFFGKAIAEYIGTMEIQHCGLAAVTDPLMDLLGAIAIPLLLLYARDQIRHQLMTEGQFFAFLYAMFSAYMPIKRTGYIYQQLQAVLGVSTQVFACLDRQEEVSEQPGAKLLAPFSHEIVFEDVGFAYDDHSGSVLEKIQLHAQRGEVIALVGSSGAGKSTLVNLLPRFHEATSGSIRIDGVDIRDVTIKSLREQIAVVSQENILFHDTVWNNICYGLTNIPKEKVVAAAQAALAHDFIQELPLGYNTVIGERGTRLSGGQRQRIAIARAILKDSPILILDEATSELDAESELY